MTIHYNIWFQVVEASDVILEVLDARDPLGCRCPQVEQAVIQCGTNKKIVLVLNKIGRSLVKEYNIVSILWIMMYSNCNYTYCSDI